MTQATAPARGERLPDPGTPRASRLTSVLAVLLVIAVSVVQRLPEPAPAPKPADQRTVADLEPSPAYDMTSRMIVKLGTLMRSLGAGADLGTFTEQLDKAAETPLDRFMGAVSAGEISGPSAGLERASALLAAADDPAGKDAPDLSLLRDDLRRLTLIYSGASDSLTDADRDALVDHHGWFGRLALANGAPPGDAAHGALVAGGGWILTICAVFLCAVVGAFVAGIACAVIAGVALRNGRIRWRFRPPAPGGAVYLHVFILLLVSFLLMKGAGALLEPVALNAPHGSSRAAWAGRALLAFQWVLALVPFYPLARAVPGPVHRACIGWTRGEGVAREVGCGIFAYLAGMPLFFLAVAIALTITLLRTALGAGRPPGAGDNPIFQFLVDRDPFKMALLFAMATLWAPFVEEAVFRGSLFRHLRTRLGRAGAALASAVAFGLMHAVPLQLTLPLIALGFNFAIMREWRGSLIAPMVAHFLHNACVLGFVISLLVAIG